MHWQHVDCYLGQVDKLINIKMRTIAVGIHHSLYSDQFVKMRFKTDVDLASCNPRGKWFDPSPAGTAEPHRNRPQDALLGA